MPAEHSLPSSAPASPHPAPASWLRLARTSAFTLGLGAAALLAVAALRGNLVLF